MDGKPGFDHTDRKVHKVAVGTQALAGATARAARTNGLPPQKGQKRTRKLVGERCRLPGPSFADC